MKWEDLRRSNNIEDLRGESQSRNTRGGLNITVPIIRFLIGSKYGRIVLVFGVIAYFLGYNPLTLLSNFSGAVPQQQSYVQPSTENNKSAEFVSAV